MGSDKTDKSKILSVVCQDSWISSNSNQENVAVVLYGYCVLREQEGGYTCFISNYVIFAKNSTNSFAIFTSNDDFGNCIVNGLEYVFKKHQKNYTKEVGLLTKEQFYEVQTLQANLSDCEPPIDLDCNQDGVGQRDVILLRVDIDEKSLASLFNGRQA